MAPSRFVCLRPITGVRHFSKSGTSTRGDSRGEALSHMCARSWLEASQLMDRAGAKHVATLLFSSLRLDSTCRRRSVPDDGKIRSNSAKQHDDSRHLSGLRPDVRAICLFLSRDIELCSGAKTDQGPNLSKYQSKELVSSRETNRGTRKYSLSVHGPLLPGDERQELRERKSPHTPSTTPWYT